MRAYYAAIIIESKERRIHVVRRVRPELLQALEIGSPTPRSLPLARVYCTGAWVQGARV